MADPITGAMAFAAASQVIGGLLGSRASRRAKATADRRLREALEVYEGIDLPDQEKMRLYLQDLELQGELEPELMGVLEQLGPSRMETVETDPRLLDAQMQALEQLQELGIEGMTDVERAQLRQIQRQAQAQQQAQQASILQEMAQRGMAGSGVELAARLGAADRAASVGAEQFDRTAAMAQQRALESIMQSGQLGGQIRGQDFDEQARIASAADAINQFNVSQSHHHRSADLDRINRAQERDLAEAQRIADASVGNRNLEIQHGINLQRDRFEDELALADRKASALTGHAQFQDSRARDKAQAWQQGVTGVGQIGASYMANRNKPQK